jgi:hypothetical protein
MALGNVQCSSMEPERQRWLEKALSEMSSDEVALMKKALKVCYCYDLGVFDCRWLFPSRRATRCPWFWCGLPRPVAVAPLSEVPNGHEAL